MATKFSFFRVSEANKALEEQDAKIVSLSAELEAAKAAIDTTATEATQALTEQLAEHVATLNKQRETIAELSGYKADSQQLSAQVKQLESELRLAKENTEKVASAKAAQIVAAQGIPPVPADMPNSPKAEPELRGLALAASAIREELTAKGLYPKQK